MRAFFLLRFMPDVNTRMLIFDLEQRAGMHVNANRADVLADYTRRRRSAEGTLGLALRRFRRDHGGEHPLRWQYRHDLADYTGSAAPRARMTIAPTRERTTRTREESSDCEPPRRRYRSTL